MSSPPSPHGAEGAVDDQDKMSLDPALAVQMGFSSFGSQPGQKKKRKFDAVVSSTPLQDQSSSGPAHSTFEAASTTEAESKDAAAAPHESLTAPAKDDDAASATASGTRIPPPSTTASASGAGSGSATAGQLPDGSWDWNALRNGVIDENGDMAYFSHGFVEDPWRELLPRRESEVGSTEAG